MEDQVVQLVVAVHQRGCVAALGGLDFGDVRLEPAGELADRGGLLDARSLQDAAAALILALPAPHLPRRVVSAVGRAAARQVAEAEAPPVNGVDTRERVAHGVVHGVALERAQLLERGVLEHAPIHELHQVKGRADDRCILAVGQHTGRGDRGVAESVHDAMLTADVMRRLQQLSVRLLAQHAAVRSTSVHQVCWVGLAVSELAELQCTFERLHVGAKVIGEAQFVDGVADTARVGRGHHPACWCVRVEGDAARVSRGE